MSQATAGRGVSQDASSGAENWPRRLYQGTALTEQLAAYKSLQPTFMRLLKQTKSLLELSWLRQPEFEILAQLGNKALSLTRGVHRELWRGETEPNSDLCPATHLEQVLEQISNLLDVVEWQLAMLARAGQEASALYDELRQLIDRNTQPWVGVPYSAWQNLARRVLSQYRTDLDDRLVDPQLIRAVLRAKFGSTSLADVLARGISTAPQVARIARQTWLHPEQQELVTIAALIQDAGVIVQQQARPRDFFEEEELLPNWPHHPAIGAGLVGNIERAPVGLSRIVAQHHERLSGRGTPRGQHGAEIGLLSRLLGVVSRFDELRVTWSSPEELLRDSHQTDAKAIEELLIETLAGDWDESFVEKLLAGHDVEFVTRLREQAQRNLAFSNEYSRFRRSPEISLRHDAPHKSPRVNPPHAPHTAAPRFGDQTPALTPRS